MNKAQFFLLIFSIVLASCEFRNSKQAAPAQDATNQVSVIIDDELWNGEIGDSIRNKFASPIVGLPQEEPLFTINQYPVKLLEGFMSNSRNIIIIKKEPVSDFKITSNEFADPQHVVRISGNTVSEIVSILERNAPTMIRLMRDTELSEYQKRFDTALADVSQIERNFEISIKVPAGYKQVQKGDHFVWMKKEIISGNMSLLVYQVPLRCVKSPDAVENITRMRDSIGSLYIRGVADDTPMITEEAYAPYLYMTEIDGRKAYETRGTWELKNDFMSGPFVNYAIIDKGANRILVLEGFCYAPSKKKRDLMHELEAIIKTVKLNTPKAIADVD